MLISQNFHQSLTSNLIQNESEPPPKKLAIMEEREEDKYVLETMLRCWSCDASDGKLLPEVSSSPHVCYTFLSHLCRYCDIQCFLQVQRLTTAIIQSMSSARQSEVKAWEEEIIACEHTLTLQQFPTGSTPASGTLVGQQFTYSQSDHDLLLQDLRTASTVSSRTTSGYVLLVVLLVVVVSSSEELVEMDTGLTISKRPLIPSALSWVRSRPRGTQVRVILDLPLTRSDGLVQISFAMNAVILNMTPSLRFTFHHSG